MKKVLPVVIFLLLAGVGVWYFLLRPQGPKAPLGDLKTSRDGKGMEVKDETMSGKLKDILGMGKSVKCTWSQEVEDPESGENVKNSGTMWAKNDKFYMEISAMGQESKMISMGNCVYFWGGELEQGMKICPDASDIEENEGIVDMSDFENYGGATTPDGVDYKCVPAIIADSKFDLPSGIEFMDLAQMFQGGFGNLEDMMPEGMEMPTE